LAAGVTLLLAAYYGARKMLETWDWYMDRFFDYKVRDYLESRVEKGGNFGPVPRAVPQSISSISSATGMKPRRVMGCLKRLAKKKQIVQTSVGWKIANPAA
jgi:hypothetical protein